MVSEKQGHISAVLLLMLATSQAVLCQETKQETDSSWKAKRGGVVLNIVVASIVLGVLGLIFWKIWEMRKGVEKSTNLLNELEDQIDIIEEESDEFVIKSIKDIREGIIFFENPTRMYGYGDHFTKIQEVHKKITKLKQQVKQGYLDIDNLRERNDWYKNQLKELNNDLERKKKENFDIGFAHGFSESLVREYD
jgi:hypothetical protein